MFDTNDVFNDAVRGSTLHADDSSVESGLGSKVVAMLLLTSVAVVGFNFYSPINLDNDLVVKNELVSERELVVKNELIAEIQTKSELLVVGQVSNSEEAYLSALREIETELTEEREAVNLDTSEQMHLSSAMTDIMDDELLADNTKYTNALRKEIGADVNKIEKNFSSVMNDFDDVMLTTNLNDTEEPKKEIAIEENKLEISLSLAMSELMDDTEPAVEVTKDARVVVVKKGDTLRGISNKFYGDAMNYKRIVASNDSLKYNDTIYEGQTILLPY